jgi:NAD(P)-dependent dehydrogenase (short-subunit alcohol dehydrogenase family)
MSRRSPTQERWTSADVGDQQGRTAVVTGANTGIGFQTARALAEHGASVVLACRDAAKAKAAADRITATAPAAKVSTLRLDLASLASVHAANDSLRSSHARLDLLINNAGVMMPPRGQTEDGFELQLGINHLGHFAFTGLVLDLLLATPGSRVVTVASPAHQRGRINFDDLQSERRYHRMAAYGQSKLANLLFTYELQRRLAAAGAQTIALAAHPGASRTELNRHLPAIALVRGREWGIWRPITQSPQQGTLSILRAAADPHARGGDYYGPHGRFQYKGYPVLVASSARSHHADAQRRLWQESERLTGVTYQFTEATARQGG